LEQDLTNQRVETLPIRFCTIATELVTGHEIWLTKGPLVQAMRASYALPGVFDPVLIGGRWLMDGALVNPIPITAARALGADLVICVNLNSEVRARATVIQSYDTESDEQEIEAALEEPRRWGFFGRQAQQPRPRQPNAPGIATVMVDAFNITQDRITRSRLAGDPPDVMIAPKLSKMGLFEFHRAEECVDLGRQAAERALPDIIQLIRESEAAL
jgi:NTE family protein